MRLTITDNYDFEKTEDLINPSESDVWKIVGECLEKVKIPNTLHVEYGYDSAVLTLKQRGKYIKNGITYPSLYVTVDYNNICLPYSDYDEKYLTCINTESNNYKFYWLKPDNSRNVIDATYGRIGSERGDAFGVKDLQEPYESFLFWIRYYEKLSKGYTDQTDIYLNKKPVRKKVEVEDIKDEKINKTSLELYEILRKAAHHVVEENLASTDITERQAKETRKLIKQLGERKTVNGFNNVLKKIMVLSPRKARYINELLAKTENDFARIIIREDNLCSAMEALVDFEPIKNVSKTDKFRNMGIEVYEATPKQKEEVMRHLSDGLENKVIKIYRVINRKQKKRFDSYLKKNHIKTVKQFWHGSINENWLSIIQNGLKLNPNAKITGKMFGYGIYFAPKARKSYGYTSCQGSFWARGNSSHGYMGLYATAFGKPDYVSSAGHYTQRGLELKGCNCVYAKAENTGLRNDEIIFYNEDAMCLNYIVEFSA